MNASGARTIVQAVVESHATHNTFYSLWSEVKDRPSEPTYPFVAWEQWRTRLVDDEGGQLCRLILIRLLIVTTVGTDRTAAQRDAAVEAADDAAGDIILALRETPYRWNITNVSTTTQFDEKTALETGVLLTFTVQTDPICLDDDAFDPPGECEPYDGIIQLDGVQVGTFGPFNCDEDNTLNINITFN